MVLSQLTLGRIEQAFKLFERHGLKRPAVGEENKGKAVNNVLAEEEMFNLLGNEVSAEVFDEVCRRLLKSCKYFPKPVDYFSCIDEVRAEMCFKPAGALPEPPKKKTAFSDFLARNPEVAQNSPFAIEFLKKRAGVS